MIASSKKTAGGHQHWHLSSIQVQAFKSFAAGTFNVPTPHLAGIVGPNGCGKSNLLEAICFAAAGSAGVLRLTGRSLAGVTSTDAGSQRPEVRLHISKGRTTHVLEACLTPEGGRTYKIDGKLKTGTQVKDFLKARGIVIDSTTVIQQAAVTGLSDSNNALALAQLVAGASGLNSWNHETAAARQEVARTHKALKDIQGNIDKVQSSVAAEDAALKAAAEAAQLEQQLEQQVQELLRGLQQRQELLDHELQDRQREEQRVEAADTACADQLQQRAAQRTALATQQATIMSQLNNASSGHDSDARCCNATSSGSLSKQVAAAEAQVASVQAAIAVRAQWAADLEQKQQLLQQQDAQCELLQQRLAAKQAEAAGLRANLAAVKSGADAAAALQQQAHDAAAASAAVQQQEEVLAAKQQEAQHADSKAQFLLQEWQAVAQPANQTSQHAHSHPDQATAVPATTAQTDCAITSAAAAASAAATAAESHMQQLQGLQQQHMRLQMQAQAAERTLTPAATAGLLAQLGSSCSSVPLHACFRLKDAAAAAAAAATSPQQLEQMLTPLSVIAGPAALQTLVAPSVSETNRLLAAAAAGARGAGGNRRLKIWPLDNLSVHDLQRQQRAAQQQLGQHVVLLPLDLLEFQAAHRPALLRAFGGFVIAADDATAAVLVERYGLSAVTLQGAVSRKGSMTGGWADSCGSHARTVWANKHRRDQTLRQLSACRQQLSEAEQQGQALQQQRAAAEATLAAAQQQRQLLSEVLQAQAAAAVAAIAWEQQQQVLSELQDRAAGLQQRLQQYQVAFGEGAADTRADGRGSSRSRSSSAGGAAGSKPATVLLQQQLQAEADRATAAAAAAEQQLEQAQEQTEELAASIEALEVRLAGAQDPLQQEAALQACLQDLHQLRQQQATEAVTGEALREQLRRLQEQQGQLEQQIKTAQQEQKAAQKQVAQAAQAVKGAAAALQKLGVDRKQAVRDFSGTDAVHAFSSGILKAPAAAADPAGAGSGGAAPTESQLQQLSRQARQLQGKLSRLDVPQLLLGQKEALAARLGQVAEFTAQADALKAAAAGLEGQITSDAEQVYAANDMVFEDVAAGFSQLCSSLLPSLELQLVRVASLAHEGLQFRFRRLQDAAAAAAAAAAPAASAPAEDATWHSSLGQLSGGQRTLVSLAMLLAVARAGGTCGLLLLDEVDAALDEVNQARVSALLRQLAHDRASACQVLCVTHNASFQGSCDGLVRVTKSASGHSVPADAQQQQEAAPPAAGGGEAGRRGAKQGKGPGAAARAGLVGEKVAVGGARKAKRVRFSVGG